MLGTSFDKPYVPDEHKKIIGPIEYEINDSIMRGAILKVAFWIAVLAGGIAFIFAITGGIKG